MNSILIWLNTNEGAMSAILTAVSVITTFIMAGLMIRANSLSMKSIQHAKDTEDERTRPYIIFDIILENMLVYVEIRNEGLTSAKNVSFKITPGLITEQRHGKEFVFAQQVLSFLAPGRKMRDFVAVGHHFFEVNENPVFECEASYENVDGTVFKETFHLNMNYLKSLITISKPDTGKELEKIRKEFEHVRRDVRRLLNSPLKITQVKEQDVFDEHET